MKLHSHDHLAELVETLAGYIDAISFCAMEAGIHVRMFSRIQPIIKFYSFSLMAGDRLLPLLFARVF